MSREIKSGLDRLAIQLLKRASDADTPADTAVDIFKAASQYYLGTERVTKGRATDEPAGVSFGDILNKARPNAKGGSA